MSVNENKMDHQKMGNLHWLKSKCQFPACIKNEGMCACKKIYIYW